VAEARAHPSQRVEVDLSELTFIDSCGLRLLLLAWNLADASAAEAMTVVNMSSAVHRVAELTGVLETLAPSRSEC
jgi:anti-anti-sigma factor